MAVELGEAGARPCEAIRDGELELDALDDRRRAPAGSGARRRSTAPQNARWTESAWTGITRADAPRLLAALPDRRDRRHGARLAQAGRRRARDLAQLRHDARAGAARQRRAHPGRPRARARRALRPRPPRPRRLPGRHDAPRTSSPRPSPSATRRCRWRSPTSARCWSRWPTPRTCSRSTTSRS